MNILHYLAAFIVARSSFKSQRGATMVEYALIIGLIAIVCIVTLTSLGDKVQDLFKEAKDAIK